MLNDNFKYLVEKKFGAPQDSKALDAEQLAYAEAHLPGSYVEFLKLYGLGHYFNRGVQFVDPRQFRSLLALIFKADTDFDHTDCHVVHFTAFGKLQVWSQRHWLVDIDLLQYQIFCRALFPTQFDNAPTEPTRKVDADFIASGLLPSDEDDKELWDFDQDEMFERCVQEHGALVDGECYGFVPSLGLVGYESRNRSVEHVKRQRALEHFALIAQLRHFRLTRMGKSGYEYLREIG